MDSRSPSMRRRAGSGGPNYDLVTSFGQTITAGMGNLAFHPSAQHPGFEFTITNFSKLLGTNPANGMVDIGARRLDATA